MIVKAIIKVETIQVIIVLVLSCIPSATTAPHSNHGCHYQAPPPLLSPPLTCCHHRHAMSALSAAAHSAHRMLLLFFFHPMFLLPSNPLLLLSIHPMPLQTYCCNYHTASSHLVPHTCCQVSSLLLPLTTYYTLNTPTTH